MANILQKWVSEQLRTNIEWETEGFGIVMKDGTIVAAILEKSNVINENQKESIIKTDVSDDVKKNWEHLLVWMKNEGVVVEKFNVNKLCYGDCSTHSRLLHQLFLNLDKRERLHFISNEMLKTSPLIQQTKTSGIDPNIAKPFIMDINFIDWQKQKAEELSIIYDHVRSKYLKNIEDMENSKYPFEWAIVNSKKHNREKESWNDFESKNTCENQNYSYGSLIKLDDEFKGKENYPLDGDCVKSYMENLEEKVKNRKETEKLQDQIRNGIETTVFEAVLDEMEFEADQELAKKVMKLSEFEKDMCNKLLETKQLARRLIQDRAAAAKMYADRREMEFQEYMNELKDQVADEFDDLNIENQRQAELHERLCAEQQNKKLKLVYEFCFDTIGELIDFAIKVADLKENSCMCNSDNEVLQCCINNWKHMFYMNQPLFKLPEYDENAMLQHIVNLQEDSAILNEKDFIEYHTKEGPWNSGTLLPDQHDTEDLDLLQRGERILGYIVYNFLDMKYPPASPKMSANLTNYKVASILLDIPSVSIVEHIRKLIEYRKIHVIRLESALIYCLGEYKNETIGMSKDIHLEFGSCITNPEEVETNQMNSLEEYLKYEKVEEMNKIKMNNVEVKIDLEEVSKMNNISEESVLEPNFKQTQTPKTIPESDIILSAAAELGKCAYIALRSGKALSDELLVSVIIEYLKSLEDMNGFVLIGYPVTLKQMRILEEALTGVVIPENWTENVSGEQLVEVTDFDQYNIGNDRDSVQLCKSRLIDDPRMTPIYEFATYFTSYIKLKHVKDIVLEPNIWDLTSENSTVLDRVYAEQGINYSIYYENISKDLLVQICKFIIGEFSSPELDDDNLFGDGVLTNLEFPVNQEKKVTGEKVKVIEKKKKLSKQSKKKTLTSKIKEKKTQTVTEEIDESEELVIVDLDLLPDNVIDEEVEETVTVPTPGDEHWIFATLPQFATNEPKIALATFWESIEKNYIESIEQLFHVKRIQFGYLVLYGRYVCDRINTVLSDSSRSAMKQKHVTDFLISYGIVKLEWCSDPAIRNDWFSRLNSLRTDLYIICDKSKVEGGEERCKIIKNNWSFEELNMLANTYVSAMTTEVNRTILTLQMLHDFYSMIVKNIPIFKEVANIAGVPDAIKFESQTKNGSIPKLQTLILNAFLGENSLDEVYEEYSKKIDSNFQIYSKHSEKVANTHREIIMKHEQVMKKPEKKKKTKKTPKKQEAVNKNIDKSTLQKTLDEWSMVLTAESNRCQLRLKMLMSKAILDIKSFTVYMANIFKGSDEQINSRYFKEVECVDRLYKILETALQKSKQISGTLILEQDQLIFEEMFMEYLAEPAEPPHLTTHDKVFGCFKINQLAELCSKLKIIGPQGHMKHFSFIYVIQDWILHGQEGGVDGMIPDVWKKLTVDEVPKVVFSVFGDAAFIDWRDFLIYCTDVKFPDFNEILTLRMSFIDIDINNEESITREEFLSISLWFEDGIEDELPVLESCLLKHFFFELFECAKDRINYTAFLLAFCKDERPEIGFAKAIALSVGTEVCYDSEVCEAVILELSQKKQRFEEERAKNMEFAKLYIDHILENVINTCDGIILTEVIEKGSQLVEPSTMSVSEAADNMKKSRTSFDSNKSQVKSHKTAVDSKANSKINPDDVTASKSNLEIKSNISTELSNANSIYSICPYVFWNILKITLPYYFQTHECSENIYTHKYKRAIDELKMVQIIVKYTLPDFSIMSLCRSYCIPIISSAVAVFIRLLN